MSIALSYSFILGWGLWMGAIIFFSFFVAPAAFRELEPEHAGRFIRTLFPRYYLFGAVCGALALVSGGGLIGLRYWPWKTGGTVLALLAGMVVLVLWARHRLLPRMNSLREEAHEARRNGAEEAREEVLKRWHRLHQLSVRLNVLVLLLGLMAGWAWLSCWLVLPARY
jgi:uncharacterized membrane protein